MRFRAFSLLIAVIAAASACALDDRGGASPATADAGLGGASGVGASGGTAGTDGGGTGGGIPLPCKGKCKDPGEVCANDVCSCSNGFIDIDGEPESADCEAPINGVEVVVGFTHAYVGHLVFRLWGPTPGPPVITLMNRPGFAETVDDGSEPGPGADVSALGAQPITFDGNSSPIESLNQLAPKTVLCDAGKFCKFSPNPGAAGPPDRLSDAFNGKRWSGTWRLCAGDSEAGLSGTLDSFEVRVSTVAGKHGKASSPANVPIPDDGYNGTDTSMACLTLSLP